MYMCYYFFILLCFHHFSNSLAEFLPSCLSFVGFALLLLIGAPEGASLLPLAVVVVSSDAGDALMNETHTAGTVTLSPDLFPCCIKCVP